MLVRYSFKINIWLFNPSRRFEAGQQIGVKADCGYTSQGQLISFSTSQTQGYKQHFSLWSFMCCVAKSFLNYPCTKESSSIEWGSRNSHLRLAPGLKSCTLCPTVTDLRLRFLGLANNPLARPSLKTPVTLLESYHHLNFSQRISYQCCLILKYFDNIFYATYFAIFSGNKYFTIQSAVWPETEICHSV